MISGNDRCPSKQEAGLDDENVSVHDMVQTYLNLQ